MEGFVSTDLKWGIIFLTQISAGILGNSSLFILYNFSLFTAQVSRPTDLILNQLVLANNLALLSKGIPQTMAALGLKPFLGEAGCRFLFSLHRLARGVSLSTICLLSGFQAIKICSVISGWMQRRIESPKSIGFYCFLCWILHLLLNVHLNINVTGPKKSKNTSMENVYRYCFSPISERLSFLLKAVIYFLSDAVCLGLTAWASSSMVLVLHRHKQRVRHIHSHSLSHRHSHEDRATCTILILVSMFVSCYTLSLILSFCITQIVSLSHWLVNTSVLASFGFPALSPFLFIFSDTRFSWSCFISWARKRKAPTVVSGL